MDDFAPALIVPVEFDQCDLERLHVLWRKLLSGRNLHSINILASFSPTTSFTVHSPMTIHEDPPHGHRGGIEKVLEVIPRGSAFLAPCIFMYASYTSAVG